VSDDERETPAPPPTGQRCPLCKTPTVQQFRPFCSKRCADRDLLRWLDGGYAIQGMADDDEDGDDLEAADAPPQTPPRRN
jgi:endogenous inhibitor of DNA gyrase (YacG/DUF329 family)